MLIYEVNLNVNADIAADFLIWLKKHIQDITALEGFTGAQLFECDPDSGQTAVKLWSVHYALESREALDNYLQNHAPAFRQDGLDRFGGKFTATRRVLTGPISMKRY